MSLAASPAVPRWVSLGLIPLINLLLAFAVSGLVVLAIGEDPVAAVRWMVIGAFGYPEAIGYTLYYATNFIFTGLAVAVAFHCGLFNIGGEGQATIGGLGVGLVALSLDALPFALVLPLAVLAAALFGAGWAFIPGYLQAKRGSHIVITTIMFNFIAASLMVYLMVNVLIRPGQQSPESRPFAAHTHLPPMHEVLGWLGLEIGRSPLNLSFLWALACLVLVWVFLWHTRWGYALRTVGQNPRAAVYGGISPGRNIIIAMAVSGALAGFVGINEILGVHHRLLLNFVAGYGFVGIAVALMGRNHPAGILLAALLFGALYQGGSELAFEMPRVTRELVVVIQGLVILFAGALENLVHRPSFGVEDLQAAQRLAVFFGGDGVETHPVLEENPQIHVVVHHLRHAHFFEEVDVIELPVLLVHGGGVPGEHHHLAQGGQRFQKTAGAAGQPHAFKAAAGVDPFAFGNAQLSGGLNLSQAGEAFGMVQPFATERMHVGFRRWGHGHERSSF